MNLVILEMVVITIVGAVLIAAAYADGRRDASKSQPIDEHRDDLDAVVEATREPEPHRVISSHGHPGTGDVDPATGWRNVGILHLAVDESDSVGLDVIRLTTWNLEHRWTPDDGHKLRVIEAPRTTR